MKTEDQELRRGMLYLLPAGLISLLAAGLGTCAFGPRGPLDPQRAVFAERSSLSRDRLERCLLADYGKRLSLQIVAWPGAGSETTRLHNPVSKITVDITDRGPHREVRGYSRGDRRLSEGKTAALTYCTTRFERASRAGTWTFPRRPFHPSLDQAVS